jgi:hypothetical protein
VLERVLWSPSHWEAESSILKRSSLAQGSELHSLC